jgi:hypothetical protein
MSVPSYTYTARTQDSRSITVCTRSQRVARQIESAILDHTPRDLRAQVSLYRRPHLLHDHDTPVTPDFEADPRYLVSRRDR